MTTERAQRPRGLGGAHLAPVRRARQHRGPRPAGARRAQGHARVAGHVTLRWEPVRRRSRLPRAPRARRLAATRSPPVDHLGGDVLAVPETWYVDTTGAPGTAYDYAVASVPTVTECGEVGDVVTAASLTEHGAGAPRSRCRSTPAPTAQPLPRPWQPMIGSERLSQLLCTDLSGGREIGRELRARAAARARRDRRRHRPRARDPARRPRRLPRGRRRAGARLHPRRPGLRPHPGDRAAALRRARLHAARPRERPGPEGLRVRRHHLSAERLRPLGRPDRRPGPHLIDRYGEDEVLTWDFEVWNEANLSVFWSAHPRRVDEAVRRHRRRGEGRRPAARRRWPVVGGRRLGRRAARARPATPASPLDFVTTHTYGNAPLDLRPTLERFGSTARIVLDRVGRHADPLQPGQRLGVRRPRSSCTA